MVHGFVHAVLVGAVEQVVGVLHRGHARQAVLLRQAHKFAHTIGRLIGQADGAHFAGFHQLTQSFQLGVHGSDFAVFAGIKIHLPEQGHVARGPMQLVEVNHIGLQSAQTAFAGFDDVLCAHIHRPAAHPGHAARGAGHFGRQNKLLAHAGVFGKPVAQKGFGDLKGFRPWRHRIHFSGVPKSQATCDSVAEQAVGAGFIDLFAKRHGAKADGGDV